MSRSGVSVPALLRTDVLDRPVNQRLETDILYPVSASQSAAKFVFDRKGILDSNSNLNIAITLPELENNAGVFGDSKSCLPTATGAPALIKRAYLEIGGRRVANLDEVGQYNTWKRLHYSNDYRQDVLMVKQGGNDVFVGSASAAYPPLNNGTIGRPSNETIQSAAANDEITKASRRLTENASGNEATPQWVIPLSSMIPMLKNFQLPLFAIAQEVSLTVEFSDNTVGNQFVVPEDYEANSGDARSTVVLPQLYIMADYLYYPDEMENMAAAITSGGGYDLLYDEVQVQTSFLGAANAATFDKTVQIALGGKKVKSIHLQRLDVATRENNNGFYYSDALETSSSYNFTIDSKPFYSKDLQNPGLQFSECCRIDDTPLRIPQARWSASIGQPFTDRLFNGHQQTNETGIQKWMGVRLANSAGDGMRMSNLPVLFRNYGALTGVGEDIIPYTLRFFITTQRMLNISNGLVNMIE